VVSRDKKTFKVLDKIIQNKLFGDLIPERFEPNSEFTVPIRYEAEGRMQIGGEIRGPNNEWLGGSVSPQVVSGEGIADVKIKVSKTLEEQGGYFFKFTMFPEGTSWKKSVANIKASPFVVSKPLRKSLKITSAAINKEGDKHIIDIDFDYSNDEDITLELTLLDNKGNLVAQKNREERKGKRSLKRNIFPKSLLPAGTYKVNLKSISVESKKVLESNKEIVLQ